MRREDWLWLVLKVAGLWLVVTAVEVMSLDKWSWFDYGEGATAGREQLLRVAVPLAAGLCLLLVDFARWLPVVPAAPAESAAQSARVSTMLRGDWLWLGLKIVGAYYAMLMIVYLGQIVFHISGGWSEWGFAVIGPAMSLALALWLLFGERVWRVAARESVTQSPAPKLRRVREIFFVVMVFAVLGTMPILLLLWLAESYG